MVLARALCHLTEGLGVPALLIIIYRTLNKSHSVPNVVRPVLLFSHGPHLGRTLPFQWATWKM